jgi:sulfite reductase (NADPH) flavoprotein alpha-component
MTGLAPMLPPNAPFSPAQQAWINGYLAALFGAGDNSAALAQESRGSPSGSVHVPTGHTPAIVEEFPWHDPALSLDERLSLADGKPFERRLMAAMAQLDCGQCGYLCQTYAEAIARGEEQGLAKCVPGGKETARKVKELVAEGPAAASVVAVVAASELAAVSGPEVSAPVRARFTQATLLNGAGSAKDTRHVVFRADDAPLDYKVGDALGVHATNEPALVDAIIEQLCVPAGLEIDGPDSVRRTLRDTLLEACDIGRPSDQAVEVLASRATDRDESERLQALAEGYPGAEPEDADLLDLLLAFRSARPPVQELISALGMLQPRLYSIASSPKARPGEVHLTVAVVRYQRRRRARNGIASVFLAERAALSSTVPVFVKPAHSFGLPASPDVPIIMIGPGTGVAPFRAFLEERRAIGAKGKNWLFFGDQRRATDFLYQEEMTAYLRDGHLAHLELAFSRDQSEKHYVQHRMRERAPDLWAWIHEGAHIYVCGDAVRMAKDVDTALAHIVAKQGHMQFSAAKNFLTTLTREGRYQRDVY